MIDTAENCNYDIYEISDCEFLKIFPEEGQDIEFIEDIQARFKLGDFDDFHQALWRKRLEKSEVNGIDGTLFYNLESRKKYYPTKRFSEAIIPFSEL